SRSAARIRSASSPRWARSTCAASASWPPGRSRRARNENARKDSVNDAELSKAWLDALEHQRRLSGHTLANYSRAVGLLFELKEKSALRDLEAAQIRRFV